MIPKKNAISDPTETATMIHKVKKVILPLYAINLSDCRSGNTDNITIRKSPSLVQEENTGAGLPIRILRMQTAIMTVGAVMMCLRLKNAYVAPVARLP